MSTSPTSADAPRPTLLVIDDEPKIRTVVCEALADDIARCLVAGSGREGLTLAAAERPVLLAVLDQVAGHHLVQTRHVTQKRHAGGVQVHADVIDA